MLPSLKLQFDKTQDCFSTDTSLHLSRSLSIAEASLFVSLGGLNLLGFLCSSFCRGHRTIVVVQTRL